MNEASDLTPVSQIVRDRAVELRRLRGLSQQDVADAMKELGFSSWRRQTVYLIEAGERQIKIDEMVGLAAALNTTVRQLMSPVSLDPDKGEANVGLAGKRIRSLYKGLYGFGPPTRDRLPTRGAVFVGEDGQPIPVDPALYDEFIEIVATLPGGWVTPGLVYEAAIERGFSDSDAITMAVQIYGMHYRKDEEE